MDMNTIKNINDSINQINNIAKFFMDKSIKTGDNNFPDIVSNALKLLNKLNIIYNEISSDYIEIDDVENYNNDIDDDNYVGSGPYIDIDGYKVPMHEGNFNIGDGYIIRDGDDFVGFRD